jgi:putative flippase GtrA
VEEPIRTIYEPGNQSSHFNPIVDSMKIYFILLRFGSVSLLTALLDGLIFYLTFHRTGNILGSQVLGRLFALTFNYSVVRGSVFHSRQRHREVLPKYLLLVLVSGTVSYGGIQFLRSSLKIDPTIAKVIAEGMLFFINFAVQRLLIFKPEEGNAASASGPDSAETPPQGTAHRWLAPIVAMVFAIVLGVEAYGFATGKLFTQFIWVPVGLERYLHFLIGFGAFALVGLAIVPAFFATMVVFLASVATAIALGPLEFLVIAFFLVSSCALGSLLLGRKGRDDPESQLFSTLLGISSWVLLMTLIVRLPVNYPAVWGALLAVPILADLRGTGRRLVRGWDALRQTKLKSLAERAAFAVLVFFLMAHWFAILMPEHSADALAMHLAVPMNIASNHRMTFEPSLFVWSVMPMAADFTYSIVYLLGGEYASHLVNFAMLLMVETLLYCVVRRWVSRATAFLLMALFATTPIVQMVTGSIFVENFQAAMVLGMMAAIWRFGEAGDKRYFYLASVFGGTALATKFGSLPFVLMGLPFAFTEAKRNWKSLGPKPGVVCLLAVILFLGAALPTYAIAYGKTGNPLFPFLGNKIVSPLLPADNDLIGEQHNLTWKTLYDLTFRTSKLYEGQNGSFGFQYLLLLPLALVAILFLRRRPAVSAGIVALGAATIIMLTQPNARYLYPALPLATVAFAALLGWVASRRALFLTLMVFSIACVGINGYFLPSSTYYHKEFSLRRPFSHAERARYLAEIAPSRVINAYFSKTHPNSTVMRIGPPDIAGLEGTVYENSWHQFSIRSKLRHARNLDSMVQLIRSLHIEYFVSPKLNAGYDIAPLRLRQVLERCTEPEFEQGDQYLAHLKPTCIEKKSTEQIPLTPYGYDDPDERIEYSDDWYSDHQFAPPWGHTLVYTGQAGEWFRVTFKGIAIRYVYTAAANRGIAQVLIDGKEQKRLNLYSKDTKWQSWERFADFAPGVHTLEVRVTGEKDPQSSGTVVDLDALIVE